MNINVYGGYYSTFVRNANKLSCSKLKLVRALLRKRLRRLTRNWFMRTTNAQQIKNLKRRLNYIHRTIERKCATATSSNTKRFSNPELSKIESESVKLISR